MILGLDTVLLLFCQVPNLEEIPRPEIQRPVVDPVMVKIAESNSRTKVIML
jgi:hypothetical protein